LLALITARSPAEKLICSQAVKDDVNENYVFISSGIVSDGGGSIRKIPGQIKIKANILNSLNLYR